MSAQPAEAIGGTPSSPMAAAGPAAWFARNPVVFRLSVGASAATCLYAVGRAPWGRGRSWLSWTLAAITALQVAGMLQMRARPGGESSG